MVLEQASSTVRIFSAHLNAV